MAALVSMLAVAGYSLYLGNVSLLKNESFFGSSTCSVTIGAAENKFMSYGAMYLMVPGVAGGTPLLAAWLANNSEPHYRRATNIAINLIFHSAVCFSFSAVGISYWFRAHSFSFQGGILGTWSFPTKDGPKFTKTMTMNLVL